jgi:meso-butanediol dehydrogenase/(S,S)-butanediol dehydrogenase/diacetyl reductase
MQLEDKFALVTGAGRGMGRAIALQMAEAGANIAVSDIDAATAEDTAVAVKQLGRESIALPADMGNLDDIDRMVRQAKDAFGRLDIVVNNAGVTKFLDIMDVQEEDWDRIHRVNAKGVFFCMQREAQELIAQGGGGRIINIASIAGKGYAGTSNAAYAASKGAVISMTHIAALQLGKYNINVNAICPGSTLTTMAADTMAGRAQITGQSLQEMEKARDARIPIGRPNEPDDIAAMAVFLAGPGGRNITGQAINVDGGLVMH